MRSFETSVIATVAAISLSLGVCGAPGTGSDVETVASSTRSEAVEAPVDAGAPDAPQPSGPEEASTAPPPPARSPDPRDPLSLGFPGEKGKYGEGPPPPTPEAIEKDGEYLAGVFEDLVELETTPRGLSARAVLRAIPARYRDEARDEIEGRAEDDGALFLDLHGAYLDESRSLRIVRYQYGAFENVFMLLDAEGTVVASKAFERRTGYGYLIDLAGDEKKELVVPVIEGNGLSSYPESWRFLMWEGGKLKEIGRLPKAFSTGSKYETYHFYNSITFPEKGKIRVETVVRESGYSAPPISMKGAPKRNGEIRVYEYLGKKLRQVSFTPGKIDPDSLEPLYFRVAVHIASVNPDEAGKQIRAMLDAANEKYSDVAVFFEATEPFDEMPEEHAVLEDIPERHRLKKRLVDRAINVFVVDEILDPHPSAATKKAAKWQGRKPSGRLAGAHIEVKNRKPPTYIIIIRRASSLSLAHEIGHFFGLPHHRDPANIMSYGRKRTEFDNRQLEVIRGKAQRTMKKRLVESAE